MEGRWGGSAFFIAPRISCHGSKRAPGASTQRNRTPPGAAVPAASQGLWGDIWGAGGEVCSEISSPTSTLSIIYLNPSILPNPSHFPWLSQSRFHSQDTTENMFDLFIFLLAAT